MTEGYRNVLWFSAWSCGEHDGKPDGKIQARGVRGNGPDMPLHPPVRATTGGTGRSATSPPARVLRPASRHLSAHATASRWRERPI